MEQPLRGVRVVEIGGGVAGAAATKTFSDYGADVVTVESRRGGLVRRLPPFPRDEPHLDRGAFHLALNTGKRSIVMDASTPSGMEVLGRVFTRSQLVILDVSPSEARPLLELVREDGPSTVTITPHGLEGPYAARRENDASAFAWSTRMHRHAIEGRPPLRYAPQLAAMQVGQTAAAAGVAAVWSREHEGARRDIEVTGVEALSGNVDSYFIVWSYTSAEQPRAPGQSKAMYPAGNYRCKDGWVMFAASGERFFLRLIEAIGHPELRQDPRFATAEAKSQHWSAFMEYLGPWLEERTRHEVFTQLQAFGVMVAPTLDVAELLTEPQALARGSFVSVEGTAAGTITLAGPPFRLDDAFVPRPAPNLGEHTADVRSEVGYSADEQIALFRAGVTG